MPSRPLRPCNHVGCVELVVKGYCDKHKKQNQKQQDQRRGNFRERGYSAQWDKVRKIKLQNYPLCEQCINKGSIEPATLVHHILSLVKGGSLLDMDNLMSVCVKCHDEIHMQQGDKW